MRDRDRIYGKAFVDRVEAMGIDEVLIAPRSPPQNPLAERVIGSISIRTKYLDHHPCADKPTGTRPKGKPASGESKIEQRSIDRLLVTQHPHILGIDEMEVSAEGIQPGSSQLDLQADDLTDQLVELIVAPS